MKGICKQFGGVEVLHNVDFEVRSGEIIALCGENGAGKSTLMKICTGVYRGYDGTIVFKGETFNKNYTPLDIQKKGIVMIHQELNLIEDMTIAQNIFLCREPRTPWGTIDKKKMMEDAAAYLDQLEKLDPAEMVGSLKVAQKQVVEIAKALSYNADLIIMDEPTAALTINETEVLFKLTRKLKERGVTIIYISHRLREIKEICDRITVLRDGYLIDTRDVDSITERQIAEIMVGREISEICGKPFEDAEADIALEVRNVSDKTLKGVSFQVRKGEIVGLSGLIGAGRTELAEIIFGVRKPFKGEILIDQKPTRIKNAGKAISYNIGFATEDRKVSGLVLGRSIRENANLVGLIKKKSLFNEEKLQAVNAERMIKKLNIRCRDSRQPVGTLSGGNQQKVVLSKWLVVDSEVLILDEPTRGVDVGAREEIYEIIKELAVKHKKAIIIISSDLTEILALSQRIIVMHEGAISGQLDCTEATEEKIMMYATGINNEEE